MGPPASPNCQIQYVGYRALSVLLNWARHACSQNVQAAAPGVRVLCLNPALHCTKEFQLLTQSNERGLFRKGIRHTAR